MKKILQIFIIIFLVSQPLENFSQTEKGRMIYGGGVSLNFNPQYSGIRFTVLPQFGGFPVKNFAILGMININSQAGLFYGMGPEFRYYVGGENVKFYVFANSCAGGVYHSSSAGAINQFALNSSVGPGIAIFAGPKFSIHVSLFGALQSNFAASRNYLTLGIGTTFNGLLSPKKKTE